MRAGGPRTAGTGGGEGRGARVASAQAMTVTPSPLPGPSDPPAAVPAVVDRALSCRSVLWARAGSDAGPVAPLEELEVRRCPVGPLLAVDCPEWSGVRCRAFVPRGDAPRTVITRDEAQALLAELAAEGTLTERYRRRLRPLRVAPGVAVPPPHPGPPGVGALPTGVRVRDVHSAGPLPPPVAVPVDRERRHGAARAEGADPGEA